MRAFSRVAQAAIVFFVTTWYADVPVNGVETLYFYEDVNNLFSLFSADTDEEKQEIYKMIYSLEIMQSEPVDVRKAYQKYYGVEWTDDIRDDVNNKVKRPIVQTITKLFFANLADAIETNALTKNDVQFLLNLFESTINEHLRFVSEKYDSYNEAFRKWYKTVQETFFACFDNVSAEEYLAFAAGEGDTINASMKWLDEGKQGFLAEKFEANLCDYKFQ